MKLINILFAFSLVSLAIATNSCRKEDGPFGRGDIYGTVTFDNGATGHEDKAAMAIIKISYGTKEPSSEFDQMYLSFSDGSYSIKGLAPGDYYLTAEYTDKFNYKYTHPGYGITLRSKKSSVNINFVLK
ncbi:MAG: carboxypeptidase regulatory-like domain-containing protein [Chitinophagaceae bacterium]|nr:MAG: carboxypeptidase regulatory-like domain-containing protein [Chitinophagaceae bacterium]